MGDKIVEVCSKLDKSWVIGIIAIILVLGLVVGTLIGIISVDIFKYAIFTVLGWFIPNGMVDKKPSKED